MMITMYFKLKPSCGCEACGPSALALSATFNHHEIQSIIYNSYRKPRPRPRAAMVTVVPEASVTVAAVNLAAQQASSLRTKVKSARVTWLTNEASAEQLEAKVYTRFEYLEQFGSEYSEDSYRSAEEAAWAAQRLLNAEKDARCPLPISIKDRFFYDRYAALESTTRIINATFKLDQQDTRHQRKLDALQRAERRQMEQNQVAKPPTSLMPPSHHRSEPGNHSSAILSRILPATEVAVDSTPLELHQLDDIVELESLVGLDLQECDLIRPDRAVIIEPVLPHGAVSDSISKYIDDDMDNASIFERLVLKYGFGPAYRSVHISKDALHQREWLARERQLQSFLEQRNPSCTYHAQS
jgi:hypothetical protein